MTAVPHKSAPTSEKFDRALYRCFTAANEYELTVLYTLLKRSVESSVDLDQYLDNLGRWFLKLDRWGTRSYRKMIIRSMNRYTNSRDANLSQQLLAIVVTHEFNQSKLSST